MSAATRFGGGRRQGAIYLAIAAVALVAPFLFPAYQIQLTLLWIMVVFALTWDIMGGQMGYNSFGNILFFGLGMYTTAVLQVGLFGDVASYNAAKGGDVLELSGAQYFIGFGLGLALSAVLALVAAAVIGFGILGLRRFHTY